MRAIVTDTARCLDDLAAAQRRVLTLRAGVGAGPPRSRGRVARQLRISERRVIRLERSGLKRLRSLDKAGACAPPAAAATTAQAADAAPGSGATMLAAARSADGEPRGRSERGAGDRSRDESRPKDGGDAVDAPPFGDIVEDTLTHRGDAGSLDLTIPLILLVLAAVAVVLVRTLRRDTTAAVVTDAPAEPAPRWVPWFRSPMRGPGWNDPRPPSDRPGEWSDTPPPPPEPQRHEEWTPPTRRSPTYRR